MFLMGIESHFLGRGTRSLTAIPTELFRLQRNFDSVPSEKGHAVAQLVEALRYKPEGRGFYYR